MKNKCEVLSEEQCDTLQELINVAYGSATSAISEILGSYATLSIPFIQLLNSDGLKKYLHQKINANKIHYVCTQITNGQIAGENIFMIDEKSASNLSKKFNLGIEDSDEELFDILLEITNILSSSTLSQFAQTLDATISFSPPTVNKLKDLEEFEDNVVLEYHKVIIISTLLNFEDEKINAELIILTTDDSVDFIKERLQLILENYA